MLRCERFSDLRRFRKRVFKFEMPSLLGLLSLLHSAEDFGAKLLASAQRMRECVSGDGHVFDSRAYADRTCVSASLAKQKARRTAVRLSGAQW